MDLEHIVLSEKSEAEKGKDCKTSLTGGISECQTPKNRKQNGECKGGGRWGIGQVLFMGTDLQ